MEVQLDLLEWHLYKVRGFETSGRRPISFFFLSAIARFDRQLRLEYFFPRVLDDAKPVTEMVKHFWKYYSKHNRHKQNIPKTLVERLTPTHETDDRINLDICFIYITYILI